LQHDFAIRIPPSAAVSNRQSAILRVQHYPVCHLPLCDSISARSIQTNAAVELDQLITSWRLFTVGDGLLLLIFDARFISLTLRCRLEFLCVNFEFWNFNTR